MAMYRNGMDAVKGWSTGRCHTPEGCLARRMLAYQKGWIAVKQEADPARRLLAQSEPPPS